MLPLLSVQVPFYLISADVTRSNAIPNSKLPLGLIAWAVGAPMLLYIILRRGFSAGSESVIQDKNRPALID